MGGGQIGLQGDRLVAYRGALDDPAHAADIRSAVAALLANGADLSHADRARPPRPFTADLLRRDGFHLSLSRTHAHPPQMHTAAFCAWCADALAPFAPIVAWFGEIQS